MDLIDPGPNKNEDWSGINVKCYATTLDRSDSDKNIIGTQIKTLYRGRIDVTMANKSCSEFFKDYWLSLSF